MESLGFMTDFDSSSNAKPFLTGRKVVAAMFAMGFLATGLLYAYWTLHLMPFMPLQEAIVADFPGSAPRVNGGQKKMHKDTPTILSISMKLQFDPTVPDSETTEALRKVRSRVAELVADKVDFPGLDYIELYVYRLVQESDIRERYFRLNVLTKSDWVEVDGAGLVITSPDAVISSPDAPSTSNESINPDPAETNSTEPKAENESAP